MRNPSPFGRDEDLALGQGVIIAARWLLVASGLVLAVIAPPSASTLRTQVVLTTGASSATAAGGR
jgi:hypothetical protein